MRDRLKKLADEWEVHGDELADDPTASVADKSAGYTWREAAYQLRTQIEGG